MKKLDFIVCGVPRSGTTVLVDLINQSGSMFCFSEAFEYFVKPEYLKFPRDLNRNVIPGNIRDRDLLSKVYKSLDIDKYLLGNKSPRYYLSDAINSGLPTIVVKRDPQLVYNSWASKARSCTWHPGQDHYFAALESIVFDRRVCDSSSEFVYISFEEIVSGDRISLGRRFGNNYIQYNSEAGLVSKKSNRRLASQCTSEVDELIVMPREAKLELIKEKILGDPLRTHFFASILNNYYFRFHKETVGISKRDIDMSMISKAISDPRLQQYRKISSARNRFSRSLFHDMFYRSSALSFYTKRILGGIF